MHAWESMRDTARRAPRAPLDRRGPKPQSREPARDGARRVPIPLQDGGAHADISCSRRGRRRPSRQPDTRGQAQGAPFFPLRGTVHMVPRSQGLWSWWVWSGGWGLWCWGAGRAVLVGLCPCPCSWAVTPHHQSALPSWVPVPVAPANGMQRTFSDCDYDGGGPRPRDGQAQHYLVLPEPRGPATSYHKDDLWVLSSDSQLGRACSQRQGPRDRLADPWVVLARSAWHGPSQEGRYSSVRAPAAAAAAFETKPSGAAAAELPRNACCEGLGRHAKSLARHLAARLASETPASRTAAGCEQSS